MMLQRREFLAFLGVGASLADSAFSMGTSVIADPDETLWFFDERLISGTRWAEAVRSQGFSAVPTSGKPEVIYDRLLQSEDTRLSAVAGLTTGMALFAISELAAPHGYRLAGCASVAEVMAAEPSPISCAPGESEPGDPSLFAEPVIWRLEPSGARLRSGS